MVNWDIFSSPCGLDPGNQTQEPAPFSFLQRNFLCCRQQPSSCVQQGGSSLCQWTSVLWYPKVQADKSLASSFGAQWGIFLVGNYLSSVQGEGKKVHEEEAGAGDAQALTCPHHSRFAWVSISTHLISLVRTRVRAGILTAELKPACSKCLFVGVFSSLLVPPAVRGVGESGSLSKVRCMLCWWPSSSWDSQPKSAACSCLSYFSLPQLCRHACLLHAHAVGQFTHQKSGSKADCLEFLNLLPPLAFSFVH